MIAVSLTASFDLPIQPVLPVVLLIAQELLRMVAEDVSKVPGIDVAILSLPHAPDQITERLRQLPLRTLTNNDGKERALDDLHTLRHESRNSSPAAVATTAINTAATTACPLCYSQ